MRIIGGTYIERTLEPATEHIYGSALRAAAALSSVIQPRLISCLDARTHPLVQGIAQMFGVELEVISRERSIGFSYYTPLSTPSIWGDQQSCCNIVSNDMETSALVFGMIEAKCSVVATGIVYDPQGSLETLDAVRGQLVSEHFAVVANMHEIRALGGCEDLVQAAHQVADKASAEVVVVKRGALGSLVLGPNREVANIGPFQTKTVWPIGSGDIFSAVFAWAWLENGREAAKAASLASAATAVWCGTQTLPIMLSPSVEVEDLNPGTALMPSEEEIPVYLAGPFFDVSQRWLLNLTRRALTQLGARVFSPLHDVGQGTDDVASRDLEGMRASKSVLGLLDGADAGTLYELGYANAQGIAAVGYASEPGVENLIMVRGMGTPVISDVTSAVYNAIWAGMRSI